jgi:hypothetical protein
MQSAQTSAARLIRPRMEADTKVLEGWVIIVRLGWREDVRRESRLEPIRRRHATPSNLDQSA